jgi:hypothetical protein
VEQVCRELGLQYATEENAGRMYVNLTGGPAEMPPVHHPSGGHHYQQQPPPQQQQYGGGYQQYPGQQQPHQQQPQQQDEIEQIVNKVLPRVLRKLGDCCIVM